MFLCKKCFTKRFEEKNESSSSKEARKEAEGQFDAWPGKSYGLCESCREAASCLNT